MLKLASSPKAAASSFRVSSVAGALSTIPATSPATNAVVASCVVFVPAVAVGAVGVPVNAGLANPAAPKFVSAVVLFATSDKLLDTESADELIALFVASTALAKSKNSFASFDVVAASILLSSVASKVAVSIAMSITLLMRLLQCR